ncbi:hypothetical protein AV530_001130 [Patagioenas fasciata monilis]|uniref:Uncharacterized protein n=1 Tax=Patagioenas fasciata monilis TaxID=372326 RepID=A0A1V4KTJ0_PATFA|nr:hypothetical protein AV530_001130 [Patagioenas fasciata monilis]OPJ87720.1 hypothetical protein AV530_001130 [Patagioenas fasciata monilis]
MQRSGSKRYACPTAPLKGTQPHQFKVALSTYHYRDPSTGQTSVSQQEGGYGLLPKSSATNTGSMGKEQLRKTISLLQRRSRSHAICICTNPWMWKEQCGRERQEFSCR